MEYETEKTVLFWDICDTEILLRNCETNIASEYAPKPPWHTGFEKSKISQPNPEKLQFKGSKIQAIWLDSKGKCWKTSRNAQILLPLNCNYSGLGWCILDFSKPAGQGGFGAFWS